MNEEELKNKCAERAKIFQQAMESCHSLSPIDCIEWFADRIAELEKENAELKEKLEGAERARDYWKDSSFDWRHKCTSRRPFKVAVKAQKQLTKAKDLLKQWLQTSKASSCDNINIVTDTEHFLKDSEVEK